MLAKLSVDSQGSDLDSVLVIQINATAERTIDFDNAHFV